MTLQNLLRIQRLQLHKADEASILKLLRAAERNLLDADLEEVGSDNRFDIAYKSIMQCAMIGLWANGYRTNPGQPGHHQTAIQSLGLTMQVAPTDIRLLDDLRRQRNVVDYNGDVINESSLVACLGAATKLLRHTKKWLALKGYHTNEN